MGALVGASVVAPLLVALAVLAASGSAAAALLTAAAATALIALLLARRLRGELAVLLASARRVASGDLTPHPTPQTPILTGELARAFDQMAAAVGAALREASLDHGRLTAALDGSIDAIVAVDAEGQIRFANRAASQLFAAPEDAVVGQAVAWVLPEPELVDLIRQTIAEQRTAVALIERANRQAFQATASPIVGGGDWAAVVLLHDVSEVRRVEQVRRDFIANVSHELRTPLASVKSVIETLEGGALDEPAVAQDFLARANAEIDRLVLMVEELLALSRIESGEAAPVRQRVDLAVVAADAVERLRPEADRLSLSLSLDTPAEPPLVLGDPSQLERVLINLIQNALKFTPAGGAVSVRAEAVDGTVEVTVRDTGVGIEAKDLPRVFERFYKGDHSRGSSGTGLGLAIVKHTIEAHGGAVRVESRPGEGSSFSLSLPAAK